MQRITMADLERRIDYLNTRMGRNLKPYTKDADGKLVANIGNFHLSGAYGGYQLQEMCNEGGGVRSLTPGYQPKRYIYNHLNAMLAGIDMATPKQD